MDECECEVVKVIGREGTRVKECAFSDCMECVRRGDIWDWQKGVTLSSTSTKTASTPVSFFINVMVASKRAKSI